MSQQAKDFINSKGKPYGPWGVDDFNGYACPHCDWSAEEAFDGGYTKALEDAWKIFDKGYWTAPEARAAIDQLKGAKP